MQTGCISCSGRIGHPRWPCPGGWLWLACGCWIGLITNVGCVGGLTTSLGGTTELIEALKTPVDQTTNELSPEQSAQACLKTAHQLDRQHHLPEAIALYERARSFDPTLKTLSRRLAVLYARTRQFDKAQEEFQQAITQAPEDADLRSDAGYCCLQAGEHEQAEVQLQEARRLKPGHKKATMHLAMLRASQDKPEESLQLFQEVVSLAEAHANLGVVQAKLGRTEQAVEHFQQARKLNAELPIPVAFLEHLQASATSVQ